MAAIFDLRHTHSSKSIVIVYCVCYGTGKRVIAVEIVLLSCIFAEKRVITLFQPPSWISDFRFYLGVSLIVPFKSLIPKT